jgi:hypothetical protein
MKKLPTKTLIYDISNLLFRVSAVQKATNPYAKGAAPEDLVGLCMHISLQSINRWYEKFRPDFVVFAFEGGSNWRKLYTEDNKSRQAYKGNRVVDPEMTHFYQLIDSFRETMSAHTSIVCLTIPGMEADDAIAGYCQLYARDGHEINIISGDKDFTQLLKLPNVNLINPDNGKKRNQPGDKDYAADLDYWLFLKCVRGDGGDHVPSAFPRVRETRIKQAYASEYERINFMNEEWVQIVLNEDNTQREIKHRVGDLFKENIVLMDLWAQPEPLRSYLLEEVEKQTSEFGQYSHFHFLRFLSQFRLNEVQKNAIKFANLFANNQRYAKGEKIVLPEEKKPEPVVEEKTSTLLSFE